MIEYITANPATVAAFLSFLATLAAAYATWQGPRSAAKLAEQIRRDSERDSERRRMKIQVFATLMQERATIWTLEAVRMLNSIDFVFSDAPNVREAWADLYSNFQIDGDPHKQLREEKIRMLLRGMAANLGLSDTLKVADLGRICYPNAIAHEHELRHFQQQQAISQLRGQLPLAAPQAPVDQTQLSKFPPKPA